MSLRYFDETFEKQRYVIAIDDGFFPPEAKGGKGKTVLVSLLYNASRLVPVETCIQLVDIDGRYAEKYIVQCCRELASSGIDIDAIILDNITFAGFDTVNPKNIYHALGRTVIAVFKRRPRIDRIKKALEEHFTDWRERLQPFTDIEKLVHELKLERGYVYLYVEPTHDLPKALEVLKQLSIHSPTPEPLRQAHIVASIISRTLIWR